MGPTCVTTHPTERQNTNEGSFRRLFSVLDCNLRLERVQTWLPREKTRPSMNPPAARVLEFSGRLTSRYKVVDHSVHVRWEKTGPRWTHTEYLQACSADRSIFPPCPRRDSLREHRRSSSVLRPEKLESTGLSLSDPDSLGIRKSHCTRPSYCTTPESEETTWPVACLRAIFVSTPWIVCGS